MKRPLPNAALAALAALLLLVSACATDDPVSTGGDTLNVGPDGDDGPTLDGFPNPDGADVDVADLPTTDIPVDQPTRSCESDTDCADDLACTEDQCGDDGFCVWTLLPNRCLINNVCRGNGDLAPIDPCRACRPSLAVFAWSGRDEGAECTDGDRCTVATTCQSGQCEGSAVTCDDGNDCTNDVCDAATGCVFPPVADDALCDDGSDCTTGDACLAGICSGAALDCDDDDPCTDDVCDAAQGCVYLFNDAPCEDGDACTIEDVCDDGECLPGGPENCDDGNICTLDQCNARVGCVNLPTADPCCQGQTSICNDDDPCTNDLCGLEPGLCEYELNTAVCNDQSACTELDRCAEGECGGRPVDCDDRNPCTDDVCNAIEGCLHLPLADAECSDGIACTIDACSGGICVSDASECVCEPSFSPVATKTTALAIGTSGQPGQGLDIDDDPSTCAPATNCSGGVNNALSLIASFVNADLQAAVDDGSLILLVELRNFTLNPFELAVYSGELDPGNLECAVQTERCDYLVSPASLDPTCAPLVSLSANRVGNQIFAGGPGTVFPFDVPLGDGVLSLTLYEVQFQGDVVEVGADLTELNGVLGGAVLRDELLDALEALPPDTLPFDPTEIANILELLVSDDIDVDGDGEPEAISIGLPLRAIRADLTGVVE